MTALGRATDGSKPCVGEQDGEFGLQCRRKAYHTVDRDVLFASFDVPDEIAMYIGNLGEPLLRVAQFLPPAADGEPQQMSVMLPFV